MTGIILILITGAAALPLFFDSGFLNTRSGGDSPFLLFRLQQLSVALGDGHFPARWMPDAAYGLGYPFFNYYAALPFYFAALISTAGEGSHFVSALKLTQLAGFLLAGVGVYLWLRSHLRQNWARLAAVAAYTFAPFHMVNVYVRGDSLGEFWAMAFFPLCFYAADRVAKERNLASLALLSTFYGALIFSHNISALIFSPLLGLYLLFQVLNTSGERSQQLQLFGLYCAAIPLGMALFAFFWAPAILEKDFGQLGTVTEGYFHFSRHFRTIDLVQANPVFDYSVAVDESHTPFAMGLTQAIAGIAGLAGLALTIRQRKDWHAIMVLIGLGVSTLMITPLSTPLWEYVPLLDFTQFPWRFLSVQALFVAAALGYAIERFPKANFSGPIVTLALGVAALAGLKLDFIPLTHADITAERMQEYEYFTGNIGTTIRFEYLPNTVTNRPYVSSEYVTGTPAALVLSGTATAERTHKQADNEIWQIEVSDASQIAVPLHYWPGWQAESAGSPVALQPLPDLGWATFELPAGTHTVTLFLTDTPIRRTANLISLLSALGLGLAVCISISRHQGAMTLLTYGVVSTLGVAVFAGLAATLPQPNPDGLSNMDFGLRGYRHREAVTFDDGTRLSTDTPTQLVRPGYLFNAPNPVRLGDQEQGVFLPRTNSNATPLTPSGQTRGTLYLAPEKITTVSSNYAETAPFGVNLLDVDAQSIADDALGVTLTWGVDRPLAQRLQLGLKLTDINGATLSVIDVQAGTGAWSSELWKAGERTHDSYALEIPTDLNGRYALHVTLYHAVTLQPYVNTIYAVDIGDTLPALERAELDPAAVMFGDIGLTNISADLNAGQLSVFTNWQVLATPDSSYKYFIHVLDPATGEIITQADVYPANGTNTTQRWAANTVEADRVDIPLPAEIDAYQLAIGWYHPVLGTRLPLTVNGERVADDRYLVPTE